MKDDRETPPKKANIYTTYNDRKTHTRQKSTIIVEVTSTNAPARWRARTAGTVPFPLGRVCTPARSGRRSSHLATGGPSLTGRRGSCRKPSAGAITDKNKTKRREETFKLLANTFGCINSMRIETGGGGFTALRRTKAGVVSCFDYSF